MCEAWGYIWDAVWFVRRALDKNKGIWCYFPLLIFASVRACTCTRMCRASLPKTACRKKLCVAGKAAAHAALTCISVKSIYNCSYCLCVYWTQVSPDSQQLCVPAVYPSVPSVLFSSSSFFYVCWVSFDILIWYSSETLLWWVVFDHRSYQITWKGNAGY